MDNQGDVDPAVRQVGNRVVAEQFDSDLGMLPPQALQPRNQAAAAKAAGRADAHQHELNVCKYQIRQIQMEAKGSGNTIQRMIPSPSLPE